METLKNRISGAFDLMVAIGITEFILDFFPVASAVVVLYFVTIGLFKVSGMGE